MRALTKFKNFMETEEPVNTKVEDNVTMTITAVILITFIVFTTRFIQLGLVF